MYTPCSHSTRNHQLSDQTIERKVANNGLDIGSPDVRSRVIRNLDQHSVALRDFEQSGVAVDCQIPQEFGVTGGGRDLDIPRPRRAITIPTL